MDLMTMLLLSLLLMWMHLLPSSAAAPTSFRGGPTSAGSGSNRIMPQLRRMTTTTKEDVPDCYDVEASAISSAPSPDDPDGCAGQRYFYDYRNNETREGLVSVSYRLANCDNSEKSRCYDMEVNGTACDCIYNATDGSITMTLCDDGADGVFDPVEQTISGSSGQSYFQLASCERPEPWKVSEECLLAPPPPRDYDISRYPSEGFCYAVSYGNSCTGVYSDGCAFRSAQWQYFNPSHAGAAGELYARVESGSIYGCGEDTTSRASCYVNVSSGHSDDSSSSGSSSLSSSGSSDDPTGEVIQCNSCEVDPDTGHVISVDCSNLPDSINLTKNSDGWQLEETEEMCEHPAAIFSAQFYSYCGEEEAGGRIGLDDLEDGICYAVDKGRCNYASSGGYDGSCTKYARNYQYYNKNNSTSEDRYGWIGVEVAFNCSDDADNWCSIEVDGTKCDGCEHEGENITMINCSNLPEDSTLQVEDQEFSVFYDSPEIVSTDEMCSHPAVEAQLGCINGSAVSGQWPDVSDGIIVPGKCFALDRILTSSRWCDGCSTGIVDREYYNQDSSGERDVYANIQIVERSNCYVGQECSITIGGHKCVSCLLREDGGYASIDCSNVPDDAMTGSIEVSEDGWSIEFVGTDEMCEHPAVIEQTGGDPTTPAMRGGPLDVKEKKKGMIELKVPSQLRFIFHDDQGQQLFAEAATSVMSSTLDFLQAQFPSSFDSVNWANLHTEYDEAEAPDEWIIKFDTHVVLSPGFSDMTAKQAARLLAGANWNHYLNRYSRKALMPHARKVFFRAVGK